MKSIIFGLLFTLTTTAQALSLDCYPSEELSPTGKRLSSNVADGGIEKYWEGTCTNKRTKEVHPLKVQGIGLTLHAAIAQGFLLICPAMSTVQGEYYGADAQATILFGPGVGAFVSENGVCLLIGLQSVGLGAQVTGTKLSIGKSIGLRK